jgi:transcription termination factor NusB
VTKRDDLQRRYEAAAHAVQAGVGMELADDERHHNTNSSASPKQLRTGVNMAMIEHGALVRILIAKGLFTEEEYFEELVKGVEDEKRLYEERLSARYGGRTKITLV